MQELCGSEICIILFNKNAEDYRIAKEVAKKFSGDGISVAFLDFTENPKFREKLVERTPTNRLCQAANPEDCVLVALRYSNSGKDKFAWASSPSPLEREGAEMFLERLIGGDVQWNRDKLDYELLP